MYLLILEFLGTNELLVILVVALMLLGPRRLPQMSRKLGKSLADFKRTSEEFKRTWEREVDLDGILNASEPSRTMLPPQNSDLNSTVERRPVSNDPTDLGQMEDGQSEVTMPPPSVTPIDPSVIQPNPIAVDDEPAVTAPARKRDWL